MEVLRVPKSTPCRRCGAGAISAGICVACGAGRGHFRRREAELRQQRAKADRLARRQAKCKHTRSYTVVVSYVRGLGYRQKRCPSCELVWTEEVAA